MRAAGLKAIDTVVESTAVLVKNRNTQNPLVDLITSRIRGVISMAHLLGNAHMNSQANKFPTSRQEIRPLPIQHSPRQPLDRQQYHAGQARTNCNGAGGGRLGGR